MDYEALTGHESGIWLYPNGNAIICNYNGVTNSSPKMFANILVWFGDEHPNEVVEHEQDVELADYLKDAEILYWLDCNEGDIKEPLKGDVYTFNDESKLLVPNNWA